MKCKRHACEMKELFTSTYCELCDLENKFDEEIRRTQEPLPTMDEEPEPITQDLGWYQYYPVTVD